MKSRFIIAIILFFLINLHAQQYKLSGKVTDKFDNTELAYSNIRIADTYLGTSANIEGTFELLLDRGEYKLITSYLGYLTDTTRIDLSKSTFVEIKLEPVSIELPQVTVLPGENPAKEIIRRAIEAKNLRDEKLNSYIFNAYTKGNAKTTEDISSRDNSIGLSIGGVDSAQLKISAIIESESKGYFEKPDNYKEFIIARKQSANLPSSINVLTGGRLVQNFYSDDIEYFGRPLPTPIADNALDYYFFYLEDTLALDKQNVFQIYFEPDDRSDPGFFGKIFIADGTFNLIEVDMKLNKAANPGGIFDFVNISQQFLPYADDIYMPIDYRISLEGNFLNLVKFGFELNSIFYNYEINNDIDDDIFDMALVTVMPEADTRDSIYWQSVQSIPNTAEEISAYRRIDSLEAIPVTFWDRFSPLASSIYFSDNYGMTGPLNLYHFNRVEGHTLNFGVFADNVFNRRLDAGIDLAYGFADKKFKPEFEAEYLIGDYRTTRISFSAYDKITDLFGESIEYNNLTSTVFNLFSKYDFRDYYYTKGFNFNVSGEVFPILTLGFGYINRTDNSAAVNTDFSFFAKDKIYRTNQQIFESKTNAVTTSFKLDFRKYIEDGYFRRRIGSGAVPVLRGEAIFSRKDVLKSSLDFNIYKLGLSGNFNTFGSASMRYGIKGVYSDGPVPFQMLTALPGNINSGGKDFTFRTLKIGEVFGDRIIMLNLQHNFGDELFRLLSIPILKDSEIQLTGYFNTALLDISNKSAAILPVNYTSFKHPFMEAGFGVGHLLFPLVFEFTWKLNYLGKDNFVFGINTFAL